MADFAKDLASAEPIKSFNVGEVVSGTVIVADQKMILIDLDDGVKKNYAIFQDVLAKIK